MSHRFVINEKYIIKIRQPSFEKTKKHAADNYCLQRVENLEQVKGIEPSSQAWEACILPMNYTCESAFIL